MNELELSYMAGFFDGEGSVSITKAGSKRHYRLTSGISQTNYLILLLYKDNFGGSVSEMNIHYETRWGRKQSWRWTISDTKAGKFLQAILPYLKLKQSEASVAIEFLTTRVGHRGPIPMSNDEIGLQESYITRLKDARVLAMMEQHRND